MLTCRLGLNFQLSRSWGQVEQEAVEKGVTLLQPSPSSRQMGHRLVTGAAQDRSAQEHLNPQAGRLPVVVHAGRALELCQEVEQHQNAQEGRFGGEELL